MYSPGNSESTGEKNSFELVTYRHLLNKVTGEHYTPAEANSTGEP
jgi:hypothetical protein